ncbi:hypothetical protein TNCV_1384311 [Trichonephila clavipes]|nr:hypothetical protein TNCV_1384311 [Trichonephila clavipes]
MPQHAEQENRPTYAPLHALHGKKRGTQKNLQVGHEHRIRKVPSRGSEKNTDHPSALDARDFSTQANTAPEHPEHPANYLDCPKNPRHRIAEEKEKKKLGNKPAYITPEPPKVNFWEQRAKTAAQRQQSTSTNQQKQAKPPTDSTSPSKQSNNPGNHLRYIRRT